jgi:DNA replication and repair protein RecF
VHIASIQLKQFRCFADSTFVLNSPIVVIEGLNGSGKTSLLEALHYICYLRSFRTHSPQELVQFGKQSFFIKVHLHNNDDHTDSELQVGFTGKKRLVKVNQRAISSYKQLMDHYRIVTLTEDDLELVKGGPDARRLFLDQALLLSNPDFMTVLKQFRHVLENRNALLKRGGSKDSYELWSKQLWDIGNTIRVKRTHVLQELTAQVQQLIERYLSHEGISLQLTYEYKKGDWATYDEFMDHNPQLYQEESRFGRSLFGAHLDDMAISFQGQKSRIFASRGQQKLIVLLVKIAQVKALMCSKGPIIVLLDDFMTDFDAQRAKILIEILKDLEIQLIFTSPSFDFLVLLQKLCPEIAHIKLTP